MARVYLPTTLAELAVHHRDELVPPGNDRFVVVTEDEDEEYAALQAAAEASAARGATRRVVLVAEVEEPDGEVPRSRWVAVHADPTAVHAPDDDLGWFGVQEIPDLLRD